MPQADAWFDHLRKLCAQWAADGLPVRFAGHRVTARPGKRDSIEAWAREVRYEALGRLARDAGAEIVLLAHHRRDQAETVLLQALRGAGVAGLAGMPAEVTRDDLVWRRPWLDMPREQIDAYVAQHHLPVIDDPSNIDTRFARNRLRADVWPALGAAFPDADVSLAATARWAWQATQVLDEVAAEDLVRCTDGPALSVAAWHTLSPARRVNALRAWLRDRTGGPPPASLIERLRTELRGEAAASWPLPGGVLRRYRGQVSFEAASAIAPVLPREQTLSIRRAGRHRLPGWGGALRAWRVEEGGVPLAWLAHVELRARQGGEQFQAGIGRPARSLKKQFQAAGLPAWAREGPLVFSGGQLVFVPGLGIDARVVGLPGQAQLMLAWEPADVAEG